MNHFAAEFQHHAAVIERPDAQLACDVWTVSDCRLDVAAGNAGATTATNSPIDATAATVHRSRLRISKLIPPFFL